MNNAANPSSRNANVAGSGVVEGRHNIGSCHGNVSAIGRAWQALRESCRTQDQVVQGTVVLVLTGRPVVFCERNVLVGAGHRDYQSMAKGMISEHQSVHLGFSLSG